MQYIGCDSEMLEHGEDTLNSVKIRTELAQVYFILVSFGKDNQFCYRWFCLSYLAHIIGL